MVENRGRSGDIPGRAADDLAPQANLARSGGPGGPRADKVAAALTDYLRGRKAKFAPVSAPLSPRAGRRGGLEDEGGRCSGRRGTTATPGAGGSPRGSTRADEESAGAVAGAVGVAGALALTLAVAVAEAPGAVKPPRGKTPPRPGIRAQYPSEPCFPIFEPMCTR